jgi:hypothetical protein
MKLFEQPILEIKELEVEDVIATSTVTAPTQAEDELEPDRG